MIKTLEERISKPGMRLRADSRVLTANTPYEEMYFDSTDSRLAKVHLYELAESEHELAIKLAPTNVAYQDERCALKMYRSRPDALECYNQALALFPRAATLYIGRASCQPTLDASIADYTAGLQLKEDAYAYYNRGNIYFIKNDFGNALQDLNRAIALKTGEDIFYRVRGKCE
jgi:tetratricopeptide (TPR) repeat protein